MSYAPHDRAGRLAMEVNPNTYDPATGSGQGVHYEYDTDDRRIREVYPDGGVRRLKYDAMGNLVKVIEPERYDPQTDDGPGFQFTYDAQGRVLTVLSPDGHVLQSNTYDGAGRLLQRLDGAGGGARYRYDLT